MHEMSIAVELMRQLEALAEEHGLERIDSLSVKAGAFQQVVPDALVTAFEAVAQGTVAAGAAMDLSVEPMVGECRACACRFEPSMDDFLCPRCGQADVKFVEGNDIILTSVSGEQRRGDGPDED